LERDETVEYYRKRAPEYEQAYFRDNPARQKELANLYDVSKRTLAGRNVLDLACGTGFWTRIISEKAASIVGIDINKSTLLEAKKKTYRCRVRLIRSDLFDLPFSRDFFDGLMATYVVSHVGRQDLDRLGETVRRVVKSGSPAFICDNNPICETVPGLIWDDSHINSYKKRRLANGDEYMILKNYYDREELVSIFKKWGKVEKLLFNDYYWAVVLTLNRKD
jgi:ubiquinone/menaquinone biosynthesis C-methylase UbiE